MVRGCQRQAIVLRGTGIFDEVYFILKPEKADLSERMMITEANRIIEENRLRDVGQNSAVAFFRRRLCFFLLGALSGGGAIALLWLAGG